MAISIIFLILGVYLLILGFSSSKYDPLLMNWALLTNLSTEAPLADKDKLLTNKYKYLIASKLIVAGIIISSSSLITLVMNTTTIIMLIICIGMLLYTFTSIINTFN